MSSMSVSEALKEYIGRRIEYSVLQNEDYHKGYTQAMFEITTVLEVFFEEVKEDGQVYNSES